MASRRTGVLLAALLALLVRGGCAHEAGGWETTSQCSRWVSVSGSQYQVTGNATVEVDVPTDSFASNWRFNSSAPVAGSTRLRITAAVTYKGAPLPAAATLMAHLHSGRCGDAVPGGAHYLQSVTGVDDTLDASAAATAAQGRNTMSLRVRSGTAAAATQPWLVDYDRALSVVLHEGPPATGYAPAAAGSRAACCDLVPLLPDLPAEWSATVEANIGDKGYTMVRQEFYSETLNMAAIVQHADLGRTVQVQDRTKNITYMLKQNATHPNGVCESRVNMGEMDGKLRTSAEFLEFSLSDPTLQFDGVNVKNVRGISCERWSRNYSIPFGPNETSRGVVYYYFPISSWSNRGESFHRLVKRVELIGERVNASGTRPYSHSYEFVNLVPAVTNRDVFNPCYVLQMGPLGTSRAATITGCGCDAKKAAPAPAGKACSGGKMVALGLLLPLFTLGLGAGVGLCLGRRGVEGARGAAGKHERLQEQELT